MTDARTTMRWNHVDWLRALVGWTVLVPLAMVTPSALVCFPLLAQTGPQSTTQVVPMTADAHPSFAVATIKPHDPDTGDRGIAVAGDEIGMSYASVSKLITFAYSLHRTQIIGGPDWLRDARYDIVGKPDTEGEPNLAQQQEMWQKLLADRFNLKFHRERRELPVYAIRIAKGGPKLRPAADPGARPLEHSDGRGQETTHTYASASIQYFILVEQLLEPERPLVDQTGLTGRFDFKLHYTYDDADSTDPDAPPGIFTAIQQQLGLKLEPTRAPVDVFVVDHVERPSAN